MKVALRISKSAALMAGLDRHGWTVAEVPAGELTERQRETLARNAKKPMRVPDHEKNIEAADFWLYEQTDKLTEATAESVKTVLDAYAEADDARKADKAKTAEQIRLKTQRTIDERLTHTRKHFGSPDGESNKYPTHCSVSYETLTPHWPYPFDSDVTDSDEAKAFCADLEALNADRLSVAIAEAKVNKAERDRELREHAEKDQAEEDAKSAQIEEWVSCQGDANQQERYAAGLLPDSEVIDAMRDNAFAPLNHLGRYDRITRDEFCTCDDPDETDCQVECGVEEEPLSSAAWDTLKYMRELVCDNVTLVAKTHSCRTDECDETLERKAVHATATVGSFTFTRLYAL